jgi:hypothetical protein
VIETEEKGLEKSWVCTTNYCSVWVHRTVRCARLASGELAALEKTLVVYGYNSPDCPVVHRTVRWANGRQHNGRPPNPRATRGPLQRSAGGTGLSGVHRTVSGAPSSPKLQRSAAPGMEGNHAPNMNSGCPVAHRTVRCATRQKAGFAFQECLQRLLAALGYKRDP